MSFDVCIVGSANLDLVATVDRLPGAGETVMGTGYAEHAGGKGLNQAIAAARSGASVVFVGAVGADAAGASLLAVMSADGVDSSCVDVVDAPTGRALIGVSATGENLIIVVSGANMSVAVQDLPEARVVLTQLEVPIATVEAAMRSGRESGATTVLNPAPAQALDESVLRWCDVVVPNEYEVELLGGVDHLLALGARAVVVTLGHRGAELHTLEGVTHIDPFTVETVDTTGAGDCFCGALCARLAAGDAMLEALRFAAAAGAMSTTRSGAVPSLPHLAEVQSLLAL